MRIAITGASGHIGNCLWRELITQGHSVRVLKHEFPVGNQHEGLEIIKGDLLNPDSLMQLCKGVEVVYHLAARIGIDRRDVDLVHSTNVLGTRNLVEACKQSGIRRLIHFSSIHALQALPLTGVLDETRSLVDSKGTAYEVSKAEGERIALAARNSDMEVVVISPTAVLGPYDEHESYLGQAVIKICKNTLPMLVPGGYDWVDVRDVVAGATAALEKGRSGERYLLSGYWVSLKDLSKAIGELTGRKTPQFVAPTIIAKVGLPFIQAWARLTGRHPLYTKDSLTILRTAHPNISSAKAEAELGYSKRPFRDTLTDTIEWYRQQGIIK